jgi:hypothetical protein
MSLDPMFVTEQSNYLLVVSRGLGFPSGDTVRLQLSLQAVEAQPIAVGDTVSGTLNDQNPADHYLFSGTPDEILRLAGSQTEGSQIYEILVYTQEGSVFYGVSTGYQPTPDRFVLDPLQVAEAGDYLLYVHRLNPSGTTELETVEYTFTLGLTETPTLEVGVPVQGSFSDQTWERVYRFEGSADQAIRISLGSESAGYAPGLSVQGPSIPGLEGPDGRGVNFYLNVAGNTAASLTYEVTLPADGAYLFRINNAAFTQTGYLEGNFSLLIESVN